MLGGGDEQGFGGVGGVGGHGSCTSVKPPLTLDCRVRPLHARSMRKITLATIGSLGDLHPFIAIGLALKLRGHQVVLAVPEDHVAKVRAAGLDGRAIMPSFETIRQRMGVTGHEAAVRIMNDQSYLMEQVLMPSIADSVAALDPLVEGADIVVGSLFAFAAAIAAEKHALPLVNVILQPMTLFSHEDPPRTPQFRMLAGPNPGALGRRWNGLVYRLVRGMLRRRYARRIDAIRSDNGLGPSPEALFPDGGRGAALTLCCYSPILAPLPPDAPPRSEVVGFPIFDSESGAPQTLDPALAAFLDAGSPPLVFTLGSFAVFAPRDFYGEAAKVAKLLNRRAVLLIGDGRSTPSDDSVFTCGYAPHSLLFPRAEAIVHHGGIGTTGQALRAGKPQIVVPHMGDQYDNGARIERLGVGRVIAAKTFSARKVSKIMSGLLSDESCRAKARHVGDLVSVEDGAGSAARLIETLAAQQ